ETWAEFESDGRTHFIVLESMIGALVGKAQRRPEFGETVAAISPEGSDHWFLLTPTGLAEIPYTNKSWAAYDATYRQHIAALDSRNRAAKRAEHAGFWSSRRQAAKAYIAKSRPVNVPALPSGFPANNEIDHFIAHRINTASTQAADASKTTIDYFQEIQPILEANCYSCHKGAKVKGGLHLDTRAAALGGGESDGPAIVPGDPEKSALIHRIGHAAGDDIMPPKGDPLTPDQIATLTAWVEQGAHWPDFNVSDFTPTPPTDDLTFLRRVALDTVGVPPTETEIQQFLTDPPTTRRAAAIDRFLAGPRWADNWMGYWQGVLAENPNIINPTLNNTGPFRWWIHESLLDNKPLDLFVTELLRMQGSDRFGGPRGFATASNNDVPMAAKGIIVASAFLGVEMKCARCHDAPAHEWKQQHLFQLAAMLKKEPV
ncbi:MAG: DUF1549 domain-containing protein, partial [Verrucomicrobiales bacterium]|nr:DUF1549 domain-containing protein [Verrucomicrobiales bacterium]